MRRLSWIGVCLVGVLTPVAASAGGKLPQMDFANPLLGAQIVWMAIILLILYFLMSRWALPQIGGVIDRRSARIADDLNTAQQAKVKADRAVAELHLAIKNARDQSQSAVALAVEAAKQQARAQLAELNAKLDAQIRESEDAIEAAQTQAISALSPVAKDITASLLLRLTGQRPDVEDIDRAFASTMISRN